MLRHRNCLCERAFKLVRDESFFNDLLQPARVVVYLSLGFLTISPSNSLMELKKGLNFLVFVVTLSYIFSLYQVLALTPEGIILYALLFLLNFVFAFVVNDTAIAIKYLFVLMAMHAINLIYSLPTDEDAIRMFAGYRLLHDVNPYLPMPTVFNHYDVPVGLRTLTEYGGFVERLIYPGLSVFAGIAEYALGYVIFNVVIYVTFILISYVFLRNNFSEALIFAILWLLFGGVNLATLLLTVGILLKKYNGFFVGLAISYNQLYILIAPFLVIYYYLVKGKKEVLRQVAYAFFSFLITNVPFMVWDFKLWFSAMLYSVSQPIVPIGFSLSRETYMGFFFIPFKVYEYLFITIYIESIILYAIMFRIVAKWAYVFPAISMIAYPRTLLGYITSWLPPAFFFFFMRTEGPVKVAKLKPLGTAVLIAIVILPIFVPLIALTSTNVNTPFTFQVAKIYVGTYGNVYKITINATVHSPTVRNITFVVIPDFYPFSNTYLWWSTANVTVGQNYFNITPLAPSQEIGFINATYTVVGVYGPYYYFNTLIVVSNGTMFSNFSYTPGVA
ncbi:membrane protein [Acidianus two-tailed virus 2]|nr:membrane protein [Acidianus two-tailed virus 2]